MLLSLFLTVIVNRNETKLASKTDYYNASQTKEKNVKSCES